MDYKMICSELTSIKIINDIVIPISISVVTGFIIGIFLYYYFRKRERILEFKNWINDLIVIYGKLFEFLENFEYQIVLRKYYAYEIKESKDLISDQEYNKKLLEIEKSEKGIRYIDTHLLLFKSIEKKFNSFKFKDTKYENIKLYHIEFINHFLSIEIHEYFKQDFSLYYANCEARILDEFIEIRRKEQALAEEMADKMKSLRKLYIKVLHTSIHYI